MNIANILKLFYNYTVTMPLNTLAYLLAACLDYNNYSGY